MLQEYAYLTLAFFLSLVIFKSSCGKVIENTLIGAVGFEGLKSAHHLLVSNRVLQARAVGFTPPSRTSATDEDPLR